ncbi:hypothetical protein [Aminipila sp.]|uniref:hypothetical protein n=1 Tax=Aminipila sp. TaxID=2060095 RepID=UPI0028A0FE74|nr:hypothetical protein [Aminipila sp.]
MREALETFETIFKTQEKEIFLDNYLLSDGTYFIVSEDGKYNCFEIERKTPLDREDINNQFLILADYYSRLISINKPVDKSKTIKSNNYLSFVVNKADLGKDERINSGIEFYYDKLKEWASDEQVSEVEKNKVWISAHLPEFKKNISDNGRLKIFFKEMGWEEKYKAESLKYLSRKIFNAVYDTGEQVLGVPNDISINAKKPYLMNKSRKVEYPLLVTLEEAIVRHRFFEYLRCCAESGRRNIYVDDTRIIPIKDRQHLQDVGVYNFTGMYMHIDMNERGIIINDIDIICKPI